MAENIKDMNMIITVDDGSRRVPIINADGEEIGAFRFHPTDLGIVERYNRLAEQFDAITAPLEALEASEAERVDLTDPKLTAALGDFTPASGSTPASWAAVNG